MFAAYGLLAACTAIGPAFTPATVPSDGSLVYIYRAAGQDMSASLAEFVMDDGQAAKIDSNGYSYFVVKPGPHTLKQIWVDGFAHSKELTGTLPLQISFIAFKNTAHYICFETLAQRTLIRGRLGFSYHWYLREASAQEALSHLPEARYQASKNDIAHAPSIQLTAAPKDDTVPMDALLGLMPSRGSQLERKAP